MRVVFGMVLVAGLALAGGAVVMVKNHIGSYQQALAKERALRSEMVDTVPVFVASQQLKYGEPLLEGMVRKVMWPENAVPEGVFTSLEDLFADGSERPRIVIRQMEKDEAILAVKVTEPGEDAGITSRLAPGMRAFALRVDVASGVSGFLRPGDVIDVYWTGRVSGAAQNRRSTAREVTKLIEAGVKLIAVDQSANGNVSRATIARTVTVAATPQQVAALALAQSTGKLSLSLVGSGDNIVAEAIEVDQQQLLGIVHEEVIPEAPRAQPRICTIRTRRGAEVVELPIPCTN